MDIIIFSLILPIFTSGRTVTTIFLFWLSPSLSVTILTFKNLFFPDVSTFVMLVLALSCPARTIYFTGASPFLILPRYNLLGLVDKITFISAFTLSFTILFSGSFVVTFIVLDFLPDLDPTLKVTSIFPSPPGGISLSKECLSQPQGGLTLVICKSVSPTFLILNSWETCAPSGTASKVKTGLFITAFGRLSGCA